MDKENNTLLETGAAIAGAAAGSGIGVAIAGPAGAIGGAAIGAVVQNAIQWIGKEVKERQLSKREEKKIGTVYELAKEKISKNIEEGKAIRNDGFFSSNGDDRPSSEEITEEIMFAAQRESEEKKLPYLSNLYANIFFDETIDKPLAFQLIRMAEQMTYRQMQIISLIGGMQLAIQAINFPGDTPLKKEQYTSVSGYTNISIATDIFALYREGILQSKSAILDPAGITPANLSVGGCGALLFNMMELTSIPFDGSTPNIVLFLMDEKKRIDDTGKDSI